MARLPTVLVWAALASASGCRAEGGKPEARPEAAAAPSGAAASAPTLTTTPHDNSVGFVELPKARLHFSLDKDRYTVRFYGFPEGTGATVGDRALLTSPSVETIELRDAIAELPAERAFANDQTLDPHLDVELRVPGYAPIRLHAPPLPSLWALRGLFAEALEHPVLFKGETPADPPPEQPSLAVIGGPDALFGPARTVRDVDRIAIVESLTPKPARRCDRDVREVDQEVVVVERRTARIVARRVFHPRASYCPKGDNPSVYPDSLDVRRWLRDEVQQVKK